MAVYLRTLLGTPDYPDDGENGYNTPQAGDIIVFGDSLHVGMCPGNNIGVGSFISGPVWLLQRSHWQNNIAQIILPERRIPNDKLQRFFE